jgi:AAA ATPase domain
LDFDITLINYRCFTDKAPITLRFRNGFSAIVGPNNCGKSTALRFFYEFRSLFRWLSALSSLNMASGPMFVKGLMGQNFSIPYPDVRDYDEVFTNLNSGDLIILFDFCTPDNLPPSGYPSAKTMRLVIQRERNSSVKVTIQNWQGASSGNLTGTFSMGRVDGIEVIYYDSQVFCSMSSIVSMSEIICNMMYIGSFRNVINQGGSDYYDITVGQNFVTRWKNWKSGASNREAQAAERLKEDIKKIFDYRTLEINPSADEKTIQVIVDGQSYMLSEVGSGLAQFIVVLANVAMKHPSFVLIDEPEQDLHPSLQMDFLTTLTSYSEFGIFFTTHSIGLARAMGNYVYSATKSDGIIRINPFEKTASLAQFAGELSFASYQELGFDKLLLVEGTTDVPAIQQFLRLFGKDHQIVVLPLGGEDRINGDIEPQLIEVLRITPKVSVLIDSEKTSESEDLAPKRQKFVNACHTAKIDIHVLTRRALENYLTDEAIKIVKGEKYRSLAPYEALKKLDPHWNKSDNWRIAREMRLDDISSTDLGKFLSAL